MSDATADIPSSEAPRERRASLGSSEGDDIFGLSLIHI